MKRKVSSILALIIILVLNGSATLAADSPETPTTTINIVGETETLTVRNPFKITQGAISVNIPENGEIFPGEKIASVPLTISNVGNMVYQINISTGPVETSEGSPSLEIKIDDGNDTYFSWQPPVINPGEVKNIDIEIYVSYGSHLTSFKGLELRIWPSQKSTTEGKG
ncbi:MAG: hypothetical protein ABH831_00290 [Candidatus Nealsonbacteria bacterium]